MANKWNTSVSGKSHRAVSLVNVEAADAENNVWIMKKTCPMQLETRHVMVVNSPAKSSTDTPTGGLVISSPHVPASGWKWAQELPVLWDFLGHPYRVTADEDCSTHIHISKATRWMLDDLRMVSKAMIYFEPRFEAVLPLKRRDNEYARSI